MKKFVRIFLGIILSFLGLLWFLQGADIVHIAPILCFSNCEIMTGGSQFWVATGVLTFIVGIIIIGFSNKKVNKK
jgi:hypothetical protein